VERDERWGSACASPPAYAHTVPARGGLRRLVVSEANPSYIPIRGAAFNTASSSCFQNLAFAVVPCPSVCSLTGIT
jgi:hypothetical protein